MKFTTPEELQEKVDAYFNQCDETKEPYTITGLALALDTTRETLLDYEGKDVYSDTIKKAKQRCHNYAEKYLYTGKNVTGAIFNLKNNYGWKDKTEQDLNVKELPQPILGGTSVHTDNSTQEAAGSQETN